MTRLCIDARLYGSRHTGIGRYVEHLIANLPVDNRIEVTLLVHPDQLSEPKLASYRKIVARFHPYSFLAQLELFFLFLKLRPHLIHYTHFSVCLLWPGKFVVTIHDLIKHYSKGTSTTTRNPLIYLLKRLGYRLSVSYAVNQSRHIVVPSQYWQDNLVKTYGVDNSKITVTYEGVSPDFAALSQTPGKKLPYPYAFYAGNLYPHKNLPVLYEAVQNLQGQVHLVLVCARSVFSDRIPTSPYIHYLGPVEDNELVALLKGSLCFVFPSLIEGFGLPGLEAMSVGVPVIAANASCLPEVYGPAAVYFDPHNPADLQDKIMQMKTSPSLREKLIKKGLEQVKKYSWAQMAHITWQVYQNALH